MKHLAKDPLNVIMAGVGGQGNVMASRVLANMLSLKGYKVTIGETFGMSQRGGSVMSHLRVSETSAWSPQIPKGRADVLIALEPIEAVRVMRSYGNTGVKVLLNTRAIHPVGVIAGDFEYPSLEGIEKGLKELTPHVWVMDATEEAMKLGNPILSNIIMIGAVSGLNLLPVGMAEFKSVIRDFCPQKLLEVNRRAFEIGKEKVTSA
ncbi:MAG TPA: indolepyruvate oxidoreductase subunit beta [Thermodesulfobacteriota bacterium]|nr:indolepyruvate oxidoreductase subunit beta [Thermodesulfobacteriota bacterium]